MLANYEYLLSELKKIKTSIIDSKNSEFEHEFFETLAGMLLMARLLDTLAQLYQHSPETMYVIQNALNSASPKEVEALIDNILNSPPSIRNFIVDDSDALYLQQLVDTSLIKSRVFLWTLIGTGMLIVVALSLLGFSTERTWSYAETAKQIVENAQDEFEAQKIKINDAKTLANRVIASANDTKAEIENEQRKIDTELRKLRDVILPQFCRHLACL